MHISGVYLQLRQLLTGQGAFGEHAADGLLDSLGGMLGEQILVGGRLESTWEARVVVSLLLCQLVARQGNLVGIDNDDEVSTVNMRCKRRLVLAPQEDRGLAGQPAKDDVSGVDDEPRALTSAGLGVYVRTDKPSFSRDVTTT